MSEIKFNFEQYDGQLAKSCMERIREAGELIRDEVKMKCRVGSINRPPYKTGKYPNQSWTSREAGAMRNTVRVVEKKGESGLKNRNIWVMAGNYKAWWAIQMEYGRRGWKGGALPFMRPGADSARSRVQSIIENG
jgi:hypothetical protein